MEPSYRITEVTSGASFTCAGDQSVLQAMEQQQLHCLPVGCRGGGCGLCKVQVLSGEFDCGRMSSRHVPEQARVRGQVLACRLFPRSDLAIERPPRPETPGIPAH
ncbi:oxidoreductase FAD-binding subunit [Pseudomonas sp. BAY1663]|uniref:2Fe-2S iron-sulfur cluster-binding protein n=1 Tax=Pseudomonas sp. BAY1663 TaxID=1439940 RepID=UPI00042DEFD1|nr:2Fe-2S iron-sulfur cluster-binding protein [Pseudomonas sp. BAY1663]EXF43946.1 oxidoreductase FAD-binding subunit [Pseudomonas sp. BAY1663]